MKRIALVRIVIFCLLAASSALGQAARHSAAVRPPGQKLRVDGKPLQQRPQRKASQSLPDAPSAQLLIAANRFEKLGADASFPLTMAATSPSFATPQLPATPLPGAASATELFDSPAPAPKESNAFFAKYLYPSLIKRTSHYQPSERDGWMGRATDAASRIFVTRDESGRRQLNTTYFLGVLTSVAVHTASRPYWARSNSAPLGDIGSAIGNDAGMNLLHEFGPGMQQMVTGHMPRFVSRIGEHIGREQAPRKIIPIPAR